MNGTPPLLQPHRGATRMVRRNHPSRPDLDASRTRSPVKTAVRFASVPKKRQ